VAAEGNQCGSGEAIWVFRWSEALIIQKREEQDGHDHDADRRLELRVMPPPQPIRAERSRSANTTRRRSVRSRGGTEPPPRNCELAAER